MIRDKKHSHLYDLMYKKTAMRYNNIREHFQERNEKERINNKSEDEHYNELIGNLREALKILADKIKPKVFEYGFLKK